MRKPVAVLLVGLALTAAACSTRSNGSSPDQTAANSDARAVGVTPTTVKLGIATLDLKAVRDVGIDLDHGDSVTAYKGVIDAINAAGGINGRKIVPYFASVNPIGTDPAAVACTKLAADDKVFAVVGFFQNDDPTCYVKTHDTPLVGASLNPVQQREASAPWFNTTLTNENLIRKQLPLYKQQGLFTGRKVAVVGLATDAYDVNKVTVPALHSLGVDVVSTAVNDASPNDLPAAYQQFKLIAQKFQNAGADMVLMVGNANQAWPMAAQVNRLSYKPQLVALNYGSLLAYTNTSAIDTAQLKNLVAASGGPSDPWSKVWNTPALKSCIASITAAHPSEPVGDPVNAKPNASITPWVDPVTACQQVNLFADIARAAGKNLTNASFLKGGESLKSVSVPGILTPLRFGPGSYDGDLPVTEYHFDSATKQIVLGPPPSATSASASPSS